MHLPCSSEAEAYQGISCPTKLTGLCWIRRGCHCRAASLRKGLWQICQGLEEALLLSLLLLPLPQRLM